MKISKNILMILALLLAFSCSDDEALEGGDLFSQKAVLYSVNNTVKARALFSEKHAIAATKEESGMQKEIFVLVNLMKENNQDVEINLALSETEVAKYNEQYGTSYLVFPKEYVELNSTVKIDAGKVNSDAEEVKVTIADDLKDNTTYMFAITISSASEGIGFLENSRTLFYTVEKTAGLIKKAVSITRDNYFAIDGNTHISDIGSTFTMEGLIYVTKFRTSSDPGEAGISTFMGTEGGSLMRFGDAGVDPNHLQANGQDIGFTFKTDRWYHIAIVQDGGTTTAYVNGKKVTSYPASKQLNEFYIGRSWSDNRGIEAKLSELRLWNVARSATEVAEGIYGVKASEAGLYAYWKMNDVKNNRIEDISGNGKNLVLLGQAGASGEQTIKVVTEDAPISVE